MQMILAAVFLGPSSQHMRKSSVLWALSEKRRRLWMNPYSPVRPLRAIGLLEQFPSFLSLALTSLSSLLLRARVVDRRNAETKAC